MAGAHVVASHGRSLAPGETGALRKSIKARRGRQAVATTVPRATAACTGSCPTPARALGRGIWPRGVIARLGICIQRLYELSSEVGTSHRWGA
jgi:hypothetical protein